MDFYTTQICAVKKPRTQAGHLHIGEVVRRTVEAKGLQKKWIASQIGTTDTNFSAMLTRYSLSTDQLERLGKVLNVNFFTIIAEEIQKLNAQHGLIENPSGASIAAEPQAEYNMKEIMDRMNEIENLIRETLAKKDK